MSKKQRLGFIFTSIILGSVFIFISLLVDRDLFRSLDYNLMVNLQKNIPRSFDYPFSFITLIGSSEIITFFVAVMFLVVLFKKKNFFFGLLLYFMVFIIELAGKLFIIHPKPPSLFNRYSLNFHFPSSFIVDTHYSYPSGHVARSSFIVLTIIFLLLFMWKKKDYIPKITMIVLSTFFLVVVLVSRIYLGEHWLSDVLGGFLLGGFIASLSMAFW